MSREYPDWVDPWKAAEGRRTFSGSVPLARLTRLVPLLADSAGTAGFSARFGFDGQRRVTIDLKVEAGLLLTCQVSLEDYRQRVERQTLLGVIEDLAEEGMLPADYEPVLTDNGRLELARLVEDELLLGLPEVPRNPALPEGVVRSFGKGGETAATEASRSAETEPVRRPFAGLGELLEEKRTGPSAGSDRKSRRRQ